MKRVFILGASQGIGFGLVKRYLRAGYEVVASSRNGKIDQLTDDYLQVVALDVTKTNSISDLAVAFHKDEQQFDVIINNAGIGPDLNTKAPDRFTFEETMAVNLEGIVFATEQLLPFLSPFGKLINVSSKMGSISNCLSSGSVAYRISKAGLNMYSKILSNRLPSEQKVAVIHPGFVRTNISSLNDHAPLSPDDAAERIYDFIERDFKSGTYWDCQEEEAIEW
jgi:NAD(P)-dependent dehydrogenase (short-subunit alcohol dehydrogenase family)